MLFYTRQETICREMRFQFQPGYFMNCCRETTKMGVPARHREPARSGEAGGPPGNRPAVPRDWFRGVPERYVAG